jgi:hypothetical protein
LIQIGIGKKRARSTRPELLQEICPLAGAAWSKTCAHAKQELATRLVIHHRAIAGAADERVVGVVGEVDRLEN